MSESNVIITQVETIPTPQECPSSIRTFSEFKVVGILVSSFHPYETPIHRQAGLYEIIEVVGEYHRVISRRGMPSYHFAGHKVAQAMAARKPLTFAELPVGTFCTVEVNGGVHRVQKLAVRRWGQNVTNARKVNGRQGRVYVWRDCEAKEIEYKGE